MDIKRKYSNMGDINEKKFYTYMKENGKKIKSHKRKYSVFDYYFKDKVNDKRVEIELKSRNNSYEKYPTTMVGYNKIKYLQKYNKKGVFYFLFTNGLYKWDYNEFEYKVNQGGRRDRGKDEIKEYAFIPIKKLKLVNGELNSQI